MADKKPDSKKGAPAKGGIKGHMFELEMKLFMIIAFIVIMYYAIGRYVLDSIGYNQDVLRTNFTGSVNQGLDWFNWLFNTVVFLSVFITLLFILGAIYYKHKHQEIITLYKMGLPKGHVASLSSTATVRSSGSENGNESGASSGLSLGGVEGGIASKPVLNPSGENKKWEDILKHINSMNSSDWRMAILEADILLYEMLDQMGYDGETIAEKLKVIESSDFNTLDLAWRAHKVRNTIAHEGASYELSHQQAQNTIDLYRKVFEEFYFV